MKNIYCTLYNSLYIDKGLVMYDSLRECTKEFKLYVLCMDDKCYEILCNLKQPGHIPIRLSDFENNNNDLLRAKQNRSFGEYCWTCTSSLIRFVLNYYSEKICTYLDTDMYFYHDPQILIDEMLSAGKSVMMVPHRFTERNQYLAQKVGTYCVEFNCFKNDEAGLKVLNHWHHKCLECCSNLGDGIHWGDQKYMDEWLVLFKDEVHVCQHPGAGVAPWNIELYSDYNDASEITLLYERSGIRAPIVFYHFQSISYMSRRTVRTGIKVNRYTDYGMVDSLYKPYLQKIDKAKEFLAKEYDINSLITSHPSLNTAKWKKWLKSFGFIENMRRIVRREEKDYIITIG